MKKIFRFRDFPVYKEAREFRKELKQLSKKFPKEEQFVLTTQLWRALDSILLNIAEGSDRYSDTDFGHFLNNSLTSLDEVISCLDLAFDDGYIGQNEVNYFVSWAEKLASQLMAFSAVVRQAGKNKKRKDI